MRGLELRMERKLMRYYERYNAGVELPAGQALDEQEAGEFLGSVGDRWRPLMFKQAELVRDAIAAGRARGDVAEWFGVTLQDIERALSTPRLAPTAITEAIEARVLERWPDTYEPNRVQPPTGRFAVPGETYIPDPHSQFSGR
ncbi:MAG: hypothetical protein Q8Q14_17000 [Gemmatimonadales bacterium]|nr:hypothetical protein [Gemmatimonadales bacterium]